MFFLCFVLFCFVAVYFETQKQVLEAGHPCFLLSSMPLSPDSAKRSLHLSFVLSAILVSYIFLSGSVKKKKSLSIFLKKILMAKYQICRCGSVQLHSKVILLLSSMKWNTWMMICFQRNGDDLTWHQSRLWSMLLDRKIRKWNLQGILKWLSKCCILVQQCSLNKAGESHIRFYFSEVFFVRSPIMPPRMVALQISSSEKTGYILLAA